MAPTNEPGMYSKLWTIYERQETPGYKLAAVMREQLVADRVADVDPAPVNDSNTDAGTDTDV